MIKSQSSVLGANSQLDGDEARHDALINSNKDSLDLIRSLNCYQNRQDVAKNLAISTFVKKTKNISGSVLNCGVYHGNSYIYYLNLLSTLEPYNYQCKLLGFDTFEGNVGFSKKKDSAQTFLKDGYYCAKDSYEQVSNLIDIHDMDRPLSHMSKAELVKGDVRETVPKYIEDHNGLTIRILHISLTLYEPTLFVLKTLFPRIVKGGYLIVNGDYRESGGSAGACLDYLSEINRLELKSKDYYPLFGYMKV